MSALRHPDLVAERLRAISVMVVALEVLDADRLPGPSIMRLGSRPGPAAGKRVFCGCRGNDSHCPLCFGSGWRARIAKLEAHANKPDERDERGLLLDEYTYEADREAHAHRVRSFGQPKERTMDIRELDRAIGRCQRDADERAGKPRKDEAYAYEVERERAERGSSFAALRRAIGEMPSGMRPRSAEGFLWLEVHLPYPLRVPRDCQERLDADARRESVRETYARTESLTKTARIHRMRRADVQAALREAS